MLTSIELHKFKCFDHVKVDELKPITIFSGPNNSGKSSLIQPILLSNFWLKHNNRDWNNPIHLQSFKQCIHNFEYDQSININLKYLFNKKNFTTIHIVNEKGSIDEITRPFPSGAFEQLSINHKKGDVTYTHETGADKFKGGCAVGLTSPYNINFNKIHPKEKQLIIFDIQREINEILEKVHYLSPDRAIKQWASNTHNRPMDVGIKGEDTNTLLHYLMSDDAPVCNDIIGTIKSFKLGDRFISPLDSGKSHIKFGPRGKEVNIKMMGTGINRILPMIVQSHLLKPNSIYIIEEPEIHLNRGIIQNLVDFILEINKEKDIQYIMTTHSIDFLNSFYKLFKKDNSIKQKVGLYWVDSSTDKKIYEYDWKEDYKEWTKNLKESLG